MNHKLIFDIGCNIGRWIEANYNENDYFIGFEANKETFRIARGKFQDKENVHIYNDLLYSNDNSLVKFYVAQSSFGEVSTVNRKWIELSRHYDKETWDAGTDQKTITIDTLISQYGIPDMIKIDVEGSEYDVLQGLSLPIKLLCFEFAEELLDELIDSLIYCRNLGYEKFAIQLEDAYSFRPQKYESFDQVMNYINTTFKAENKRYWGMIWCKL